ncbi:lactonase family protein [Paraburkholderia acidisoli]|uniref:Beta-propeller fold lactonase family protein n=1 Tax=Paraburkholderia acidisoli TaxID=2571748 RepID=A0A7Z2GQN7_9BURK|nr:lactonase family protein [Paraburkholderia acidisoli]QGZ66197.1 beta-propeller fold lactonase family protein [Paraburkholderia acidisoli]
MQAQGTQALLVVGTYTLPMPHVNGQGKGLYVLGFDTATGRLSERSIQEAVNPSYVALSADRRRLYAVREVDGNDGPGVSTFELDPRTGALRLLNDTPTPGGWPCHVSVDNDVSLLLVSNYATGEVLRYRLDAQGVPAEAPQLLKREGSGPNAARQDGPHAHCALVSPDKRHVYLADLGIDGVVRHRLTDGALDEAIDTVLPAAAGAGPRHLVFTLSGKHLLVNYELSSTVRMYALDETEPRLVGEISTLPELFKGESATGGMRLHPSGKFVYVGNRGHDSVFAARIDEAEGTLTPIGTWAVEGRTPRDLRVSPDGTFLLAASQDDGFIRVFSIDPQTGALSDTGHTHAIPSAVCIEFI